MRRQEFSQTRERLKLTMLESPRVAEDEVIVVDADDTTDKEEEFRRRRWKSLLTATRNVLFMPNSLLGAEKVPYGYLRELIEVIGSTSKGSSVECVADMWKIVLNLVSLMKATYEETKIDPEFKLITIDLLTHYVNFKARTTEIEINHRSITANELERKREDLYMKIFLLLDGAIEDILMLLMNLDVQKKYDGMLYPLFKNVLTNPKFHKNLDSISYVRRILCFRKWKKLTLLREERKIIYEYADKIIPSVIPKANNDSRMFFEILSPFATKRKKQLTRFLLESKYVNDQKQVQDFFRLWRRSLSDQDISSERFFRDIISSLPEVEETDLQSTFFKGRSEKIKETSKGGNGLCWKSQGIGLVKKCVEKSKVGGRNCSSKSVAIPYAPVINLCDSEDEIEQPMPVVEILDSDEEIEGRKADDTAEMPTETAKQVPTEDTQKNDEIQKDSVEIIRRKRRMPKRKLLKVPRRRILRTRKRKILVRKRKVKKSSLLSSIEVGPEDPSEIYSNVSDTPLDDDILVEPISEHNVSESVRDSCNATPVLDEHPIQDDENTQCFDEQTEVENSRVIFSTSFKGPHWKDFYSKDLEEHPPNGARVSVNRILSGIVAESDIENNKVLSESREPYDNAESSSDKTCRANSSELNDSRECEKEECGVDEKSKKEIVKDSAESSQEQSTREDFAETATEVTVESMEVSETVAPRVSEKLATEFSVESTPEVSEDPAPEVPEVCKKFTSELSEIPGKLASEIYEKLATEVTENLVAEISEELNPVVPEEAALEVSEKPDSNVAEELGAEVFEEISPSVPEEAALEVSDKPASKVAEQLGAEVSEEISPAVPEETALEVSDKPASKVAEEPAPQLSKEIILEVSENLLPVVCDKLAPAETTPEEKSSKKDTEVPVEETEEKDKIDSEYKYPEFSDISDNEISDENLEDSVDEVSRSEEVSVESIPTEETTTEVTTCQNDEDDDEDDVPLKNLSSNKNQVLKITYRLQRTRKYKPAGTYCEDSPLLYEEFFSNGAIFEDLPEETEPAAIETQQDFMKIMNLRPREAELENHEETQDVAEIQENNNSVDDCEALPMIPIENGHVSEDSEKTTPDECPVQESNISSVLGNNDDDFKTNKEMSVFPSLDAPKLKILPTEDIFCVDKSSVIIQEQLTRSKTKSLGKKVKKKRQKYFTAPHKNNFLKPPFLKSALKSSNAPTSPIKRRVSFNLDVTEADTQDFFKCYRVRKRREDSSDESISGHSHKRKSGKESKKKKRHKRSPLYQNSAINDLDTEFQERFSQCLSIGDLPKEAEDNSRTESPKNSERIHEVADETEDRNSSEESEVLGEMGEGSEISTPEGADFMNEEENDDAVSVENVERVQHQDNENKNEDDELFAENDDPPNPIEFGDISGDIFVSSSSENEDDTDQVGVSARNDQNLTMMHVEVMLEKIIDSKKFCKQRGIKYISRQNCLYQDVKRKKSKKCKHKHKKRRKSRKESKEMVPEDEMLVEQLKNEKKCNEATEEELCEMSPMENNPSAVFTSTDVPTTEKSPGSMKLKVRPQEELMVPEMRQIQSIQQVETLDLENVTRLDYHYLDNHYLFDTSEAHSNIKEDIEQTIQNLITLSEGDDFTNRSEYFEYDGAKGSSAKFTNSSKGSDEKTPYTEESPGVIGLLNDDMTMMTSVMPIDICPQKNGTIEMVRRQQQVVSMSDILAPKKATPEPPAECMGFYDSGSDKNITGESFCDENHSVQQDNSKMPGFSESPHEIRPSSPYVRVLSFDDIHMGKDLCDEPCDVLTKFHMTSPRRDNEFVTINKKDLADISSVSIPPDIPQNNVVETLPAEPQPRQEMVQEEVQQVPEPDKSIDVSDESSNSCNSLGNLHEVAKEGSETIDVPENPESSKKPLEKPRPKVKSDRVVKVSQKESQIFFPIKCNERIPVSKHTPIKNRSTATYSTSKTTIIQKSPSPARRTITSTREVREKTSHSLLDMPQLIDDDVEETERFPSKSPMNKSYVPKRKPEEVPKSPGLPKLSGDDLFDQLKKAEQQTKLIGKIPLKRSESTSTVSSMGNLEITSPLEAVTKQPDRIHPPPAKIAKIHPQVVDKEESRRRKHGQVYRRDPFRNPEITTTTMSPEMKARENLVKELGLSTGVDDSTLKNRIEQKLCELNALPTPLLYSEHKELRARKESLQKHLSIVKARLDSSSSYRSKPIALVPPSSANRVKSPVASSSFDRFQAGVSSSSSSSTPTKSRPQSSSRPQMSTWKPEHIPTEVIIATYKQKAKDKQSKRHHYVYT